MRCPPRREFAWLLKRASKIATVITLEITAPLFRIPPAGGQGAERKMSFGFYTFGPGARFSF